MLVPLFEKKKCCFENFFFFTLFKCNYSEDAFSQDACFISNGQKEDLNFTHEVCHL